MDGVDNSFLKLVTVAQSGNQKFKDVGDTIYNNAVKSNPDAVKMLRQLVNSPEFMLIANDRDKKSVATLKLLAPRLFEEPPPLYQRASEGAQMGNWAKVASAQKALGNVKTQAELAGIDTEEIAEKKNKGNFWTGLANTLYAPMRSVLGIMHGAEKHAPPEYKYKDFIELLGMDYEKNPPQSLKEMTQIEPIKAQREKPDFRDTQAIKDIAKGWWQGLTNTGEMKDYVFQDIVSELRGPEGNKRFGWAENVLTSESGLKVFADAVNRWRVKNGRRAYTYEEWGLDQKGVAIGKAAKFDDFIIKAIAAMIGSPNAMIGTLGEFTLDPLVTQPVGKVFTPLNKLVGSKVAASTAGKLFRGAIEPATTVQKALAKVGKGARTFAKALSMSKDPIEQIMRKADAQLGYNMNKFLNDTLMPTLKKAKVNRNSIEKLGKKITDWLDKPFETKMTVQMLKSRKPVTTVVIKEVKEILGKTKNVDEVNKIISELTEIDNKLAKYYDKIEEAYTVSTMADINVNSKRLQAAKAKGKMTPEQGLKLWVKEKGGLGIESAGDYAVAQGNKKFAFPGEYEGVPGWLKSKKSTNTVDVLVDRFIGDEPELADALGFRMVNDPQYGYRIADPDATRENTNLFMDILKGGKSSGADASMYGAQGMQKILNEKIAEDAQKQVSQWQKTHYSQYITEGITGTKYDKLIESEGIAGVINEMQDGLTEARTAGNLAKAKDIEDGMKAFIKQAKADYGDLITITKNADGTIKANMKKLMQQIEITPDEFLRIAQEAGYNIEVKIKNTLKNLKAGLKQRMPVLDFSNVKINAENIEVAIAAKKLGLRSMPVLFVDTFGKTKNLKTIAQLIDKPIPAADSLTDLLLRQKNLESTLKTAKEGIEPVSHPADITVDGTYLDEQGNVIKYIDKGTGKEVSKKVKQYVTDYVDIETPKKVPEEVPKVVEPEVEEIGGIIKQDLRQRGIENLGEDVLKENYVPYRPKREDMPKMIGKRQRNLMDYLSPEKPIYEYQRKFKSIAQRVKAKISTERNAFKTWTQYVFEGYKKEARNFVAESIRTQILNQPVDTIGTIIAKDAAHLTPNERMFWRQTNIPEFKGMFFDPEHAAILERANTFALWDDATKTMMNMFDNSLHLLKGYLTVANIGFHTRNFISNFWHLYLGWGMKGFDPRIHMEADTLLLSGRPQFADQLIDAGRYGKMRAADLLEMAGKTGTYNTGFIRSDYVSAFLDKLEYVTMPKWQRVFERFNPTSRHFALIHAGDVVGGYVENHARLVGFINGLQEGLDFEQAAAKVKKFMIDYTDLSAFERNIGRRVFPFYSWLRKNTELEVTQLLKQPGKFALIPKIKNYIESLSEAPDDIYLPDYYKDLYAIRMPFGLSPEGKLLFGDVLEQGGEQWYLNPNFPWQDLGKIGKVLTGDWLGALKEVTSALNPMGKIPIELITNTETFSGNKIADKDEPVKLAPGWMQWAARGLPLEDILPGARRNPKTGELYITGRQEYGTRILPPLNTLSKLMSASPSDTKKDKNKWIADIVSQAGLKFMPFNLPESKANYAKGLQSDIESEIAARRISGEKIPMQYNFEEALRELYLRTIDKETGYSGYKEIQDFLKYTGSSPELDYVIKKLQEPYKEKANVIKGDDIQGLVKALKDIGIEPTMEELITILNEVNPDWAYK